MEVVVDNTDFKKHLTDKQLVSFLKFKEALVEYSKAVLTDKILPVQKDFYLNENEIIRICIAREFDLKQSLEMWKNWVGWREANNPNGIKESDIVEELKIGKVFLNGVDNLSQPIIIAVARRHFHGVIDKTITTKIFIHCLEEALKQSRIIGSGRVNILIDMTGYTKKNFSSKDGDLIKKMLSILQDNYPESLGKLIIYKANWLFKLIFAIVKPFLSKRTKQKIIMVATQENLVKHINVDQLSQEYGGKSTFQYAYPLGSKPINVLEGKIEECEPQENEADGKVDQNMINEEDIDQNVNIS